MLEGQHFRQFKEALTRSEGIVKGMFPIESPTKRLEVTNLRWTNVGPDVVFDVEKQKQAKLKEQSINAVLVGDVTLRELGSKGKVLDQTKRYPILSVPHLTMNAGYIVNGKEQQVVNQFRLRPGIYTRFTGDDNVEAFLNTTAIGTYKILLDRSTGVIRMRVGTAARTPIYSVLIAAGLTDAEIKTLLGTELYAENKRAAKPDQDIPKLLKRMRPYLNQPAELGEKSKLVRQYLESKPLDPAVNKVTVGEGLDRIDRNALVAAIKKVLKLSKGEAEPDDTESLAFKYILSIEDFVPERLQKAADGLKYKIQGDMRRRDEIRLILPPNRLSQPVESFFTTSEFTRYSSQHNPLDMAAISSLTTTMGDGGISSSHAITDEVRTIHPSHYGLLDPMHTPEGCCSADMEVMTDQGWVAWPDVDRTTRFACLDADQGLTYHRASELHVYDHDGPLYGFKSETLEYLLTPNHRQWVRPIEDRSTRGYRFETAEEMYGKRRRVRIGGHLAYEGQAVDTWQLPEIPKGSNSQKVFPAFAIEDWAEFLGWYLSEGSSRGYVTSITQYEAANPENVAQIEALLTRMQVAWSRSSRSFSIPGKQLVSYLRQFGHSDTKYIPKEAFDFPAAAREAMLEALMLGDGRKGKGRCSCYCTTSEQLAKDVQRLAFGLGVSSKITFEPDTREEHYRGCWIVHLHALTERQVLPQMRAAGNGQFIEEYQGKVYCATVPGGLLYIRRAGKSGFWSGNSKVGVTGHLALGARKKGQTLYVPVYDAKTGKRVEKSVQDLDQATIAFPDQYDNLPDKPGASVKGKPTTKLKKVKARSRNEFTEVSPSAVDYIFVSSDSFFSSTTAAIPFLPNNDANRVLMGDKHIEQSVNLEDPDAPMVQHRIRGRGYEEMFGERLAPRAIDPKTGKPVGGEVLEVTKTHITIRPDGGGRRRIKVPIHDHYPLNSRTFLHDEPVVKKGDKVKPGQILARNNFTKDGDLAVGKNLRVAYTAYKGYNFEDGIVISEGAAKKLTSVHKYEARVEKGKGITVGADAYAAAYPSELEHIRDRARRYDAVGVIKKGQQVVKGDVLIPAIQEVEAHPEYDYKRLHRSAGLRHMDISETWNHDFPGEVVDVVKTRTFVKVVVKSKEPMQVGDKLSSRHGAKGIVVKIIPDEEMYKDEEGATIDILLNPAGVPGRVNTGQMLEAAAGKLARKTGKKYYTDNFNEKGSTIKNLRKELAGAGISDEETIVDPKTGHKLERVLVGDTHIYKLTHQVTGKMKARASVGEPYSVDEQPVKGSGSGAQRIGILDTFSLLSGDATAFLEDAFGLKSQKNDEYWRALQTGQTLPPPKTPFIEEKFVAMLIGAGIDLKQKGSRIDAGPLTDAEVLSMSNGAIERPVAVKASNLKPERGGLFDPGKTGGPGGNYWNHIDLASEVVHPLMTDAAASVGGFKTKKEMDQIIQGLLAVTEEGEVVEAGTAGAVAGGSGVKRRLATINVPRAIKETELVAATAKGAKLDKAHKRLRYLRSLQASGHSAVDAYINKTLPVIPAKFRQIAPMPDGSLSVADANHGYREVLLINEKIKQLKALGVDEQNLRALNKALADATAGLVGTAPPISRGKVFRGFVSQIHGPTPKSGLAQSKLMGRNQDLSGRSTVIPNPKLGMDEVGIPAEIAYKIYKPFVIKRLVTAGHKPLDARSMVEQGHPAARRALEVEAEDRPVLMNRAPSLHKFNIQALKPRVIDGKAVEVNPLIVSGYNMDFDGDTAGLHVPVSEEARREAREKLLPSRNLFSPREEFVVHAPTKETILGVYLMTTPKGLASKSFSSDQEMVKAYQAKEIKVNEAVKVQGAVTCAGQAIFNTALPMDLRVGRTSVTGPRLSQLLVRIGRQLGPDRAAQVISKIKDLGNHYVTEVGFSVSLRDLELDTSKRDQIVNKLKRDAKTKGFDEAAGEALEDIAALLASAEDNRFVEAGITSGALGSKGIHRMLASTVAVTDHKGKTVPIPVEKSYAEGHDLGTYLGTTPGARKGLIDKGLSVADTGYFSRMLVNSSIENQVTVADCGTKSGQDLPLNSQELAHRYGAEGRYRNVLITSDIARRLRSLGQKTVKVRSPLTCQAQKGVCQKCFGLLEDGKPPRIGYHVGALAGQTLGEVATQLTLRSFHTGGAVGGPDLGFERIRQIMEMPQSIQGKAILSEATGQVTRIDTAPAGGSYVYVGSEKHFIPKELGVAVSRGQRVKAGDQLSKSGVIKPQELLDTTGDINRVRTHLINELDANYRAAGKKVNRRIFETVVKPLTDRATVTDVGDAGRHFPVHAGEVMPVNQIEEMNRKLKQRRLRPIQFEPMIMGIKQAPFQSEDFVGTLTHEKLKRTLTEAPSLGKATDLVRGHPMARLGLTNLRSIEAIKRPQGVKR